MLALTVPNPEAIEKTRAPPEQLTPFKQPPVAVKVCPLLMAMESEVGEIVNGEYVTTVALMFVGPEVTVTVSVV